MKKKLTVAVVAIALALCCAVGGTLAWLVDKTETVTNTFTAGDVEISLWEHTLNSDGKTISTTAKTEEGNTGYKMIPGTELQKDPTVTVDKKSEKCYVFIKVTEENNVDTFLSYAIDTTVWTELENEENVYYRVVDDSTEDQDLNILTDKKVTVLSSVDKTALNALSETTQPKLSFTAYAIQFEGMDDAADAWAKVSAN